jgi:hypothetical protein
MLMIVPDMRTSAGNFNFRELIANVKISETSFQNYK